MFILLSIAIVASTLGINELWWRKHKAHEEYPRKIIHMLVGTFVALWPLYLSWNDIRVISVLFLAGVVASRILNVFTSIHAVERFSVGEICFAVVIGIITFLTKSDWLFTAAILQMAIADGLAAIVGTRFGKGNGYKVFGAKKSLAGNLACFISSLGIILIAESIAGVHLVWYSAAITSLAVTIVESVAGFGLDDLLLPVVTVLLLRFG